MTHKHQRGRIKLPGGTTANERAKDRAPMPTAAQLASKHTPGPWSRNIPPATKYNTVFAGRNTHVAHLEVRGMDAGEIEGNCNLIAAAPDLLAFAQLVARMKTESEFGEEAPPSEDWISTLNDLIIDARLICRRAEGR